jgi:3-oxoacyl-[acyl-carrier-protein] synthase III
MVKSIIIGTGSYLPEKIVTNNDLAKLVETTDEWIFSRTGIKQRHIVAENELTSDLALQAAKRAIESAQIKPEAIDLILVCTTSPDRSFPSTAAIVQSKLDLHNIPAFDIQAVCAGFVYGIKVADSFIRSKSYKTILVIGAETMSKLVNWQDRNTCVLFGDGAGAVILQANDNDEYGIIECNINAEGSLSNILYTDGGVSLNREAGYAQMLGKDVFKHAVEKMSNSITTLLHNNHLTTEDIDWLIPHQANSRILEAIGTRLDFPASKIVMTLDKQANTSAATIGLALDHHFKAGKIKSGDTIILTALGAGLAWGGCLLKWK